MNPMMHCRISRSRWGGTEADYYAIHNFIDSTKILCSDCRHRILHTHWGVNQIVIPIFGHTLINSDGKAVDVKDMCERDHLLADYGNRFIPTLGDFVSAVSDVSIPDFASKVEQLHSKLAQNPAISEMLLSPLAVTGQLKSLLITHNSWFINQILPKIFQTRPIISNFAIAPSYFFNAMQVEPWMDNGLTVPASAKNLCKLKQT